VLIRGGCHCGNIRFALEWRPEPSHIDARACGCSFCLKHGGLWTSCPGGTLEVTRRDPVRVQAYTFGTGTAEFHVCRDCGVVPVVTSDIGGRRYAVVSVHAFEDVDPGFIRRAPASFEGESTEQRLKRRERGWIPDVRFS
jgi:hypothetical protein